MMPPRRPRGRRAAHPEASAGVTTLAPSFHPLPSPPVNPIPVVSRPALAAALLVVMGLCAAPGAWSQASAAAPAAAASAPALRPEVAKPLAAAQDALKAGNAKDALARLAEAEALPGLTPYETYILRRLKGPALFSNGEIAPALAVFESVLPMADMPAADRPLLLAAAAKLALQLKDYPKTATLIRAHLAAGGSDADLKRIYPQVLALGGDHAGVLRELTPQLAADAAAGRSTPEATLRLLASSQNELGDKAGYNKTVELLAASTGKADYWGMLVNALAKRDGFADERLRLDVYRLKRAAGLPLQGPELADMAWRAQQAGLPAEAQALIDDGYAKGLLGSGADAAEDKKLRDSITKAAAQDKAALADSEASAAKGKDGNPLFNLGFAVSGSGAHDKALALMTAGQAKGGLRRPDDANLHLALAQWRAGKADDALKTLATVQGADGTAELARLWTLLLKNPAKK